MLMVLGNAYGNALSAEGDGGKVRKGGFGDGRWREVNLGSKSTEDGVQRLSRIANVSFDPCKEAVLMFGTVWDINIRSCRTQNSRWRICKNMTRNW